MRILVVEDDEVAAEYVRKGLMEAGHVVDLAPDGDLGLEMARAADYDALILDRMLPKLDGLELLGALREDCLLYTSPSPRDRTRSRMPSSA